MLVALGSKNNYYFKNGMQQTFNDGDALIILGTNCLGSRFWLVLLFIVSEVTGASKCGQQSTHTYFGKVMHHLLMHCK